MKAEHGLWRMAKRVLYFILVIVGQYFLFRLTNWLFRKLKVRILRLKDYEDTTCFQFKDMN